MQMLDVDEYYMFRLQGKTEEEILKEIQRLKENIAYLEREEEAMKKEEEKSLKERLINWYWEKVRHTYRASYERGCVRIEWHCSHLYLERAEQALAEIRAMKANARPHKIVIIKVCDE